MRSSYKLENSSLVSAVNGHITPQNKGLNKHAYITLFIYHIGNGYDSKMVISTFCCIEKVNTIKEQNRKHIGGCCSYDKK